LKFKKFKKKYEKEKDYTLHISDIQKKNFNLSCLEIIENLGIQEQQFVKQLNDDTEKCIEVPQKFTTKLCKPINVNTKITNDCKYLRNERVDEFTHHWNIPDDIYDFLSNQNRVIYDKNKPSNCGNRIFSRCEYITSYDWYKTYNNLAVDIEKKQWKRIY
jgi:hypothetical protein